MAILRSIVGIVCELGTMKDPYEKYESPRVISETRDECGRVISQRVRAASGTESTRHLQGTTIQGNRSVVSTHRTDIKRGTYDIHIEDWKNKPPAKPAGMHDDDYFAWLQHNGW